MTGFINKFRIPTLLGLGLVIIGIVSGVYLTLREQTFLSQASPNLTPKNITLTNMTEDEVVISWQTNSPTASFVTFGQRSPAEQTVLDDRDKNSANAKPTPRLSHYVTLKNLLPETDYQFKIVSGKIASDIQKFKTAKPLNTQTGFTPIIGSVLDGDKPAEEGIVYLSIPEAITQSALIKQGGNFLIPLSEIRRADLSDAFNLRENVASKLTIKSNKDDTSVLFKLKAESLPLPPINLGQDIDLTTLEETPSPTPSANDLEKYDLNGDGKLNAADNAIILKNFGNSPKDEKADLNGDGKVNQQDLDLMSQKLTELGSK